MVMTVKTAFPLTSLAGLGFCDLASLDVIIERDVSLSLFGVTILPGVL
jgi:hypothetical protein